MTKQKVWFITGAARGIGSDLAKAALKAGHQVVATARDVAAVSAGVGQHEQLLPLSMDVTDSDSIDQAIHATLEHFGRIDVLINNAGRFSTGFFETVTPDQVRDQMEVTFLNAKRN